MSMYEENNDESIESAEEIPRYNLDRWLYMSRLSSINVVFRHWEVDSNNYNRRPILIHMHMCTHIVSFIENTATSEEEAGYVCVAFLHCS